MYEVAIWTPVNKTEGFGHFYRMMGLYEQLLENDISTTYFTNSEYIKLEQVDILQCITVKIKEVIDFLKSSLIKVLIIDNYNITLEDLGYISKYFKVVFFDAKFKNPNVDVIINFNPYAFEHYLTKHDSTMYFLGLEHMYFRKDLMDIQNISIKKDTVFISIGGTDITETTYDLLKYLPDNLIYHIILGKGCSDKYHQRIFQYLEDNNFIFHIYIQPNNYFELMSQCEFAICSCSTTTYELIFLDKQFLCINVISNQNMITSYLNKQGVVTFKKDCLKGIGKIIKLKRSKKPTYKKNKYSTVLVNTIKILSNKELGYE
ncbi:MAG: hypothetical protein JKX75_00785 [Gammaproteobacteria bacterium]|nr:hypothetical protein [Gammaproteobacteria bacterium]